MLKSSCPAESELLSWLEGTLDFSKEQTLAEHVEHCGTCEQRLQQMESQSRGIAGELRKARSVEMSNASFPVTISIEQFQQQLIEGGFLTKSTLAELVASLNITSTSATTLKLAQQLVSQKILTPYQAEQFQLGKGPSLVLGNYVILDKIGAGGMGEVFKARHKRMDRLVAIKLLPAALKKQEDVIQRFHREVKAAAKLTHPNIVIAHDADEAPGGIHFLVMEYVAGRDLAHVLAAEKKLPVDRVLNYILQAAHGLAYAHENGVVHRDIKPANLLLNNKGTVKILDMGLARIHDAAMQAAKDGLTKSGDVMGTVDYMAPEQAFDTHTVDGRADIYSLGCTLYRLLTGKNVFEAESIVQKLMAHQSKPVPSLQLVRADVSVELDSIFQKMIAKRVEDRYQNMSAVILAIEAISSSMGNSSLKQSTSSQTGTFVQEMASSSLQVAIATTEEIAPTINLSNHSQATDPVSDRSIHVARDVSSQPLLEKKPAGTGWRNRNTLIAAGAGGFLLVLFAIWVIIRDKDGNEIARVKVPEGSKAEIITDEGATTTKVTTPAWHNWPAGAPKPAIAPFTAEEARKHQDEWAAYLKVPREWKNGIGMKFVLIPPGEFMMGSTAEEIEAALKEVAHDPHYQSCVKTEAPRHRVVLTKPMYLSVYEVTQSQYEKVMGTNPSNFAPMGIGKENVAGLDTTQFPVERVSWNNAAEFCVKLSLQEELKPNYVREGEKVTTLEGTGYRFPSEAEWEFACRGGTTTKYWNGDRDEDLPQVGWFRNYSSDRNHTVGELKANPFGLYDIHGNVAEWVQDGWDPNRYSQLKECEIDPIAPHGTIRMARGGESFNPPVLCRSAFRLPCDYLPDFCTHGIGIRVLLPVDAVKANLSKKPVEGERVFRDSPDYQFALWLKTLPAPLMFEVTLANGNIQRIEPTQALPLEPFRVHYLFIQGPALDQPGEAFVDEFKKRVKGQYITGLQLYSPTLTSEQVVRFAKIPEFSDVSILAITSKVVDDKAIDALAGLHKIKQADLTCPQLTGKGLHQWSELEALGIHGAPSVTPEAIEELAQLPKLRWLDIIGPQYTERHIEAFAKLKLPDFVTDGAGIDDALLTRISKMETLKTLVLKGSPITDTGLPALKVLTGLSSLNLIGTKVTAAGVADLQTALPNCKIEWDAP